MTARAAAAAAILVACGPSAERETVGSWSLDPASEAAPDGWEAALEAARLAAPWCGIPPEVWGGVVRFVPDGAFRTTEDVPTWYPGDVPRIGAELPGTRALRHGACHVAQMMCGADPHAHDAAFYSCAQGDP